MAKTITLQKQRVAKNGMTSYKEANQRAAGTVYFDKKMFVDGAGPETLTVTADNLADLPAKPEPVAAPAAVAAEEPVAVD